VTGGWRKLHNEELHNLYFSPSYNEQVKEDEMGKACSTNGEKRNAYRILVGKPEEKRALGRPRHRWEGIKMDRREVGWGGTDCIDLAPDRDHWRVLMNTIINVRVP
jgi:hypothetical protein